MSITKKITAFLCVIAIFCASFVYAETPQLPTTAKSVLLMEQSTKQILYENNPDEKLPIASVTKIMTLLLIMEAIDEGKITMDDMVSVSERAMSMGGSTMFLEAGEELSVYEMIKGIAVASANDGCVAMAEHISGSVEAFVEMMNNRAKELNMTNTNFVNTNGLDEENHYSTARDVALMSCELLKHEKIFEFTKIWTDKMHDGKFDLSNTNKLIRFYPGANGLKTGSTSKAQCCLSASALRDDMQLVAVVLAAPTSDERFNDARTLLDYGFANYCVDKPLNKGDVVGEIEVKKGVEDFVNVCSLESFSILLPKSEKGSSIMNIELFKNICAPVKKGDVVGKAVFTKNDEVLGEIPLVLEKDVQKKSFGEICIDIFSKLFKF